MPLVDFSLKARTKLEQRLARRLFHDPALLESEMANIRDKLQAVFPHAKVAIAQELYCINIIRGSDYSSICLRMTSTGRLMMIRPRSIPAWCRMPTCPRARKNTTATPPPRR
jgi:hypothetical protein